MLTPSRTALVAATLGALSWSGCAARDTPCAGPSLCGPRHACIAGACRPAASEPAPPDTRRVVVAPDAIAVVSSSGGASTSTPSAIAFGAGGGGSVVLLLRFPAPWGRHARIASAFLTLDPAPGALPETEAVSIDVARVLDRWSPSDVDWGRQPRLSTSEARALAKTAPPRPLRIDVTAIVKRWQRAAGDEGIALVASPTAVNGASYATGAAGGVGPRLEVYLR